MQGDQQSPQRELADALATLIECVAFLLEEAADRAHDVGNKKRQEQVESLMQSLREVRQGPRRRRE